MLKRILNVVGWAGTALVFVAVGIRMFKAEWAQYGYWAAWAGLAMVMAYMIGLSYVAKQENLTQIQSLWPLLFLASPFVYAARLLLRFDQDTLQYVLFLVWAVFAVTHLFKKRKNIPRAVVSLIAGISLLDGLLIASVAPESFWSWLGIVGFGLTILLQRYVPGT